MSSSAHDSDLIRRQYSSHENLSLRQATHDLYTVPKIDFPKWTLACVDWQGHERVLDVGSGTGTYFMSLQEQYPDVEYYGMDISVGMLSGHPADNYQLACADAMQLPYPDASFDVIMANHMMYHLPDPDTALKEFKRVLRQDGVFLAATNSTHTMPELQVLMRRAIVLLTREPATQVRVPAFSSDAFALENGTRFLVQHFFGVVRYDIPSQLVFSDIDPAMAYLESTRIMREPHLPDDVAWDDVMLIMRQQITQLVKHLGKLEINKLSGALVASDRGGKVKRFLDILQTQSEVVSG